MTATAMSNGKSAVLSGEKTAYLPQVLVGCSQLLALSATAFT
jgi:hypothetical protein